MTYRLDSDIVMPYGWFYPRTANVKRLEKSINYAQGKTKLVAWFVSNCHRLNGRLEYAERLQDFVTVDIYGKCGTLNCAPEKTWQDDSCRDMVDKYFKSFSLFSNNYLTSQRYKKVYQIFL